MSRLSENVEASTSHNPKGLHDLYRDNFIFTFMLDLLVYKEILTVFLITISHLISGRKIVDLST
jgi:hypothetical protein